MTPDEEAELRWLEEELLRRLEADYIKGQARAAATVSYEDMALAAAAGGNLERLRGLVAKLVDPRAAKWINPPEEWPKGKHRPKSKRQDADGNYRWRTREAYKDARMIRDLWRERDGYAGRRHGHLAEWYAARLWDLGDEEEVKAGRPSGRRKS